MLVSSDGDIRVGVLTSTHQTSAALAGDLFASQRANCSLWLRGLDGLLGV